MSNLKRNINWTVKNVCEYIYIGHSINKEIFSKSLRKKWIISTFIYVFNS